MAVHQALPSLGFSKSKNIGVGCHFLLQWLCSLWGSKNQFSCSVVSDSLRPQGLKHTGLPCLSLTMGVCSNSCPSSPWCHPPSHHLLSPSPPALSSSQNQSLFQWVSSSQQSVISSVICKDSWQSFYLFALLILGMILITASCTVSWTSVHSSSNTLSDLSPWIVLSFPLYTPNGFD